MQMNDETIVISNPEKILFPKTEIRKIDILQYYEAVGPYMLPYLQDRPVSMQRFPDGITKDGFFQKSTPLYFPEFIERVEVEDSEGVKPYAVINNLPSLLYIANHASIPIHTWQSRKDNLDKPDQVIWDLDPSDDNFEKVRMGARLMKYLLEELGLQPYIKTTGSKGLHLLVPIKPQYTYEVVKEFSRLVAVFAAQSLPQLFTTEIRKNKRQNKIFVDYLRNQYGHTAVAPYAVRPIEGAPVAMPITWAEMEDKTLHPQKYNISNVIDSISRKGDIWNGLYKRPQSLTRPMKKLAGIIKPEPSLHVLRRSA